jgi:integrase
VFRYAVQTERAAHDVTADLRGALAPVVSEHHAAITEPVRIGELLRAIDGYTGHGATAYALKLAPLLFVRPGELRHAEWPEFDLDGPEPQWRIPAEKMKMGEQHLVPLSKQAVALLRELQPLTGRGPYLFPSIRSRTRPMSDNTVNAALRRLGYTSKEMTGHGFRSLASTCLNEQGYHPDLIELQLAHAERNKVRAAYNKAQRLPERRKMMQAWSDYLDQLVAGSTTGILALGLTRLLSVEAFSPRLGSGILRAAVVLYATYMVLGLWGATALFQSYRRLTDLNKVLSQPNPQ